jgi:hypothetical protein
MTDTTDIDMDVIVDGFQTVAGATSIADCVVTESLILTGKRVAKYKTEWDIPGQVRTRDKRLYVLLRISVWEFLNTLHRA